MEAGEFHELVERVEHLEHEQQPRIRTIITILIPVVTVLTALTSLLAARDNGHAAVAQRLRTTDTIAAQRTGEEAAQQIGRYNDINAAFADAVRRNTLELRDARTIGGTEAEVLRSEAAQWARSARFYHRQTGSFDLPQLYSAGTLQEQQAFEAGTVAQEWIDREDANIGLAGLFAVALFLLGLTMTLPRNSVKWGFVTVACLLGLIGIVRLALINLPGVHHTPETALVDYSNAILAENSSDASTQTPITDLTSATKLDPEYGQAWVALGEARDIAGSGSPSDATAAITDYQHALSLDQKTADVYNNMAYDEILLKRSAQGIADSTAAHDLEPDNPYIDMTLGEAALSSGDMATATHWRSETVSILSGLDSNFRDHFFTTLRSVDIPELSTAGVPTARLAAYFNPLRNVEASLDAFGSPTPRPLDGASLSDVRTAYYRPRALYLITYQATDVHTGDIVSVRVYNRANEGYSLYSSYPKVPMTSSGSGRLSIKTPIDRGKYRIEFYLNGNFQTETTVKSPGD